MSMLSVAFSATILLIVSNVIVKITTVTEQHGNIGEGEEGEEGKGILSEFSLKPYFSTVRTIASYFLISLCIMSTVIDIKENKEKLAKAKEAVFYENMANYQSKNDYTNYNLFEYISRMIGLKDISFMTSILYLCVCMNGWLDN